MVTDIETSFMALRERCAPDAPVPEGIQCVIDRIREIIILANDTAIGNYGGKPITVGTPLPDTPACLTAEYLAGVKAWIDSMTCDESEEPGSESNYAYLQTLWYFSWSPGALLADGWDAVVLADGNGTTDTQFVFGDIAMSIISPNAWRISDASIFNINQINHLAEFFVQFPLDGDTWATTFDYTSSRWLIQFARWVKQIDETAVNGWIWVIDPTWDHLQYYVSDLDATADPPETFPVIGYRSSTAFSTAWSFEFPEGYIIEEN